MEAKHKTHKRKYTSASAQPATKSTRYINLWAFKSETHCSQLVSVYTKHWGILNSFSHIGVLSYLYPLHHLSSFFFFAFTPAFSIVWGGAAMVTLLSFNCNPPHLKLNKPSSSWIKLTVKCFSIYTLYIERIHWLLLGIIIVI